ncbi:MAG: 3'-5' exonuclease, partial [Oscillospiraceae bacterium]
VTSTVKTSFLDRREVSCVLSFLKAINNPLYDIDLVASMMSPLFCFTAEEIATIRLENTKQSFYLSLTQYCKHGAEKANYFLNVLQYLRYFSNGNSIQRLLSELYKITDFLNLTFAIKNGAVRYKNLLLLQEYAQKFEANGTKGLHSFIRFVDKLQENKKDFESASPSIQSSDTVKIMSIHSSKGLEFPVVFICDTAKEFNRKDIYSKTMLHSQHGFACMRRNNELSKEFTTIPLEALKLEAEKSMLSEELRILYVALTRAKERIIITGTMKKSEKKLSSLNTQLIGSKIPSFFVREANSYADWIAMTALHHLDGIDFRRHIASELDCIFDGSRMSINLVKHSFIENKGEISSLSYLSDIENTLQKTIQDRINFIYPNHAATKIPTKMGISSLVKGETNLEFRFTKKPKFLTQTQINGADRGNLLHKFMQFANYKNAKLDIDCECQRLLDAKFFTYKELECLDLNKLAAFFKSDTANLIFNSPMVKREMKFYTQAGRDIIGDYYPDLGENTIVLQGIADCVL